MAKLNQEFDSIRLQILGNDEIPLLNEVIIIVSIEESKKGIMFESQHPNSLALISKSPKPYQKIKELNQKLKIQDLVSTTRIIFDVLCKKSRHLILAKRLRKLNVGNFMASPIPQAMSKITRIPRRSPIDKSIWLSERRKTKPLISMKLSLR